MSMRSLLTRLSLLLALIPAAALGAAGFDLWRAVETNRDDQAQVIIDYERGAQVRARFSTLMAHATRDLALPGGTTELETVQLQVEQQGDTLITWGRAHSADGLYAIRVGADIAPLILQAPHSWYDLNTGRIAALLFQEGLGRAVCFNTAHRYRGAGALLRSNVEDADVAHRTSTVFQAATLGMVDSLTDPLVVQLHGFGADHGEHAAVIAAGRALQPQHWLELAVTHLSPVLAPYGDVVSCASVPDLCATTNVQSQALAGRSRFLHIELSYAARKDLLTNTSARQALAQALRALAERER